MMKNRRYFKLSYLQSSDNVFDLIWKRKISILIVLIASGKARVLFLFKTWSTMGLKFFLYNDFLNLAVRIFSFFFGSILLNFERQS